MDKNDKNCIANFARITIYPKIKSIENNNVFKEKPTILELANEALGILDNKIQQVEKKKAIMRCICDNIINARCYIRTQMQHAFAAMLYN